MLTTSETQDGSVSPAVCKAARIAGTFVSPVSMRPTISATIGPNEACRAAMIVPAAKSGWAWAFRHGCGDQLLGGFFGNGKELGHGNPPRVKGKNSCTKVNYVERSPVFKSAQFFFRAATPDSVQ